MGFQLTECKRSSVFFEMSETFRIESGPFSYEKVSEFIFGRKKFSKITVDSNVKSRVESSQRELYNLLEKNIPIYGVTTGFGDSGFRVISANQSEKLQKNLISYLLCGTGELLPRTASKAILLFRLISLSRGYSGVSFDLIERMKTFVQNDWVPVIPQEGSLGASGDLIPLAYIAQALQGEGQVDTGSGVRETKEVLKAAGLSPYTLKPKEGLALVNGTSAMAGLSLINLNSLRFLTELSCLSTSWLCIALKGRTEAFGKIVNEKARSYVGQAEVAKSIRNLLAKENHQSIPLGKIGINGNKTETWIQDRYSLRCTPQILGPVLDTLMLVEDWVTREINGVSDNPIIDGEEVAMGGNFYGGYLSHGMDYLKICIGQVADLLDRQLMTIIDEKSNRGLPPNLANWDEMEEDEKFLHHGLKGVHQSVSALTSEILARVLPNSIFSRSSESHNQDKVSLGMSAAVQCSQILETLFTIQSEYLICLAQALDLRKIQLKGSASRGIYEIVREAVPFVEKDKSLGAGIQKLSERLKKLAHDQGRVFSS